MFTPHNDTYTPPRGFEPPSPALAAAILPLLERLLTTEPDAFGNSALPLIRADSPEFVALKIKPHPQILGLDPATTPLAAIIGMAAPAQVTARFGSPTQAVAVGQTCLHGAALLYGLQTAAIRFGDVPAAEALVSAAPRMKLLFQYSPALCAILPPARMDEIALELTMSWRPDRDMLIWYLLEYHRAWSVPLSRRMIETVAAAGTDVRHPVWTWRGNGYADNMHSSLLADAIEAARPHAHAQANAKRWITRLKKRESAQIWYSVTLEFSDDAGARPGQDVKFVPRVDVRRTGQRPMLPLTQTRK